MNKRFSKTVATLLVASMLLGFAAIFSARAYPAPPAFYLVPDSQSFLSPPTTVGTTFHEWLNVSTSADTFTYQYEVDYNTAQLNCTNAVYFAGATSDFFKGHTTVATGPDFTTTPGKVVGGETLLGSDVVHATATGKGIIDMTFMIMLSPPINGNLTSQITLDPSNTYLLDPSLGTVSGVTLGPCTYLNVWAAPPAPHFEVVPSAEQDFAGNVVQNGTTFTVTIAIKGAAGWFADNASVWLNYNSALIVPTGWSFDPAWTGTLADNTTAGVLKFSANAISPLTGDTNLVTVTFKIWNQGSNPPRAPTDFDISPLHLTNATLGSFYGFYITLAASVDGSVKVFVYSATTPPFLSVSSITLGPNPVVGTLFNITVTLNNVAAFENIIGVQFRLSFDKTMIYPVTSWEGPFLPSYAALQPGSLGTFFVEYTNDPDGAFGPHEVVGNMIFPNGTGSWNPPMLNGTGVVTTIEFQVLLGGQSFGEGNLTTSLNIVDEQLIALDNLIAQNIITYPLSTPQNGTVTITTNFPGRMIDEYGGAVNSYMMPLVGAPYLQWPAPYGGQGPNMQMDLVEPQSLVYLHANVTYNYWPVQFKNVAFEVDMPNGSVYTKMSAFTDANGVATVSFRMPWPCDIGTFQHSMIGVWTETSTVQLADVTINDTLNWHYDFLVNIWKVTTDMFQYNHGQCVQVTFIYGSHATQSYPVLFVVTLVDELGVTVGIAEVNTTVSGATDCTYVNGTATVEICIPKWAYAGIATIHVDAFNMEPSLGGVALGPEYVGPTIAIQPY